MAEVPPEVSVAWDALGAAIERMRMSGHAAGLPGLLQAVQGFRRGGDRSAESYALDRLAGVHLQLGNFAEAVTYAQAGLEAARSLAKPGTRIAKHLDTLGIALSNMGRWQEAERVYQQALDECRRPIRDLRVLRATVLKHLGDIHVRYANRANDALQMYDEAIAIARDYDETEVVASSLLFKGQALDALQRSEEAIQHYEQARALLDGGPEAALLAGCYAHLSEAYLQLSNAPLARQYVDRALALDRQCGNKQGICRDLATLGRIHETQGDERAALDAFQDALLLAREIGDRKLIVILLMRLASSSDRQLQGGRAAEYLEQALVYARELNDKAAEIQITALLDANKHRGETFATLEKRIVEAREQGFRGLEEHLEFSLAQLYERHGDLLKAREHYVQAAGLLEQMRNGYGAEEHLRAFSESHSECFDRLVDISLQLREDADAFVWAERSRARVAQILRQNRSARAGGVSLAHAAQHRQRCNAVVDLDLQIQRLERSGGLVSPELRDRLQQALLGEVDATLSARRASGGVPPADLQLTVAADDFSRRLDDLPLRVVALSYYVADSGIYVFCCTGDACRLYELGSSLEEVRESVRRLRAHIGVSEVDVRDELAVAPGAARDPMVVSRPEPSEEHRSTSRELYDLLLRPIQNQFEAADHLCIIPHGPLHLLPFHALHDGERFLIERCVVSYAPSATILAEVLQAPKVSIRRALALGEPASDLQPLPHARKEVTRVQDLLGVQRCRAEIGPAATRSVVLQSGDATRGEEADDVWHFAMHATYVQSAPHLSYLQLAQSDSDDGRLFAYEIASLDRVASVDVMSACRTAMTRESRGDELSGLVFAFLVAGAHTVLATLWSVADESTAELMVEFYKQLETSEGNFADALRQAQLALLRRPATASPYYWAPITLHGSWNAGVAGHDSSRAEVPVRTSVQALRPVEVLMRLGDSLIGRARIAHEEHSLSPLSDDERKALEQAVDLYTQVLEQEPSHAAALRQRGIAHYGLRDTSHAEVDLREAARLNEGDPVAAAVLGLIHMYDRKDVAAAVACLDRAFRLEPRLHLAYPPFRTPWLREPLERGRAQLTIDECTRKLVESPEDARLYAERGYARWQHWANRGDDGAGRERALEDLNRALALDPASALALTRKTWIENRGDGPLDAYERAIQLDPHCAEAHLRLAQRIGDEDADRAIAELHRALDCDAAISHVHCQLGLRYLDKRDLPSALRAFETEISRDPNCFNSHLYLSHIYFGLGRRDDAQYAVKESIRTSAHATNHGGPGIVLVDSVVHAIRDLARGMLGTQPPEQATVSLAQMRSLFDKANDLTNAGRIREALDVYSDILRHDPGNGRAYAFRGGCHAALNEIDNALSDLERSTELEPGNADAWLNLALVYLSQQDSPGYRRALERARLLDPGMVRRRLDEQQSRVPPAQREPFDLHSALAAAYRGSTLRCAVCSRPLRRPLGTQFQIPEDDAIRVQEGIPHYCPLCRVSVCGHCVDGRESALTCRQCGTGTEPWGEARRAQAGGGVREERSGPCVVCGDVGSLRLADLCARCYGDSSRAIAELNFEGQIAAQCARCNADMAVQLGAVFASASGDLQCAACIRRHYRR